MSILASFSRAHVQVQVSGVGGEVVLPTMRERLGHELKEAEGQGIRSVPKSRGGCPTLTAICSVWRHLVVPPGVLQDRQLNPYLLRNFSP